MNSESYHVPVLLAECVEALIDDNNGVYVDATFGGGGHSREVLSKLGESGRLIAFDQDEEAARNAPDDKRFTLVQANFSFLKNHLRFLQAERIDGLLADLGVSSHQIDTPERGFSIRHDARLDMRMGAGAKKTAEHVVNKYSAEQLERVLRDYGELREWKALAAKIVEARIEQPIRTTGELMAVAEKACFDPKRNRFMSKLFQAIRIEVNGEMEALKALLEQSAEVLKPGGKLVVMSYHSLEDRLVKRFMRSGKFEGDIEKDFFGNPIRPFKPLPGMPITPGEEELKRNTRSRSVRLRVAIKNEQD
ncbi:MAG: 16S rRNA (cytosine(1402)-N(4))-methyltransferase RsmH [Cryomorphaceae bacterium]|nr:16S rRNA (cytosine(1402)-N(4))-methyltransferase RsmH [Flavobacteriales bacterium]